MARRSAADRPGRDRAIVPVEDALHDLDATFLACRDLQHAWSVEGYRTSGASVLRRLTCQRCGTERLDDWSTTGFRNAPRYRYTAGYQLRGVDYPTDRLALRREVLRRAGVLPGRRRK